MSYPVRPALQSSASSSSSSSGESLSLVRRPRQRKRPMVGWWCCRKTPLLLCLLAATAVVAQDNNLSKNNIPNPALQLPNFAFPDESRLLMPNGTVGTFRTNFCDASFRVLVTREIPLDRALEGWNLNVAMLASGDFAKYDFDDDGNVVGLNAEYPGLMPLILDEICRRAGCFWRDTFAYVPKAFPGNQTFSDLLRWTTNVYDISINFWSRSIERLEAGATYTESWYDGSIIMVAVQDRPKSDSFDPWGWLAPFDSNVWLMILVTLIFSTIVHWLLEVVFVVVAPIEEQQAGGVSSSWWTPQSNPEPGEQESESSNLWMLLQPWETLWKMGTAFTGHFEFEPTTGPGFLFSFSVAFWALLMGAAYTANLASFLVIRNQPTIPVNTFEEAVQREKRLCVQRGTQQDLSFTSRFPNYGNVVRVSGGERFVIEAVQEGICDIGITEAAAWNVFQRDATLNGNCNLAWIGRPLESIPASFSVKSDAGTLCTSLLRDVFNVHLIKMESEGVIRDLWNQHLDRIATVDCSAEGGGGGAMSSDARRHRQLQSLEEQLQLRGVQYGEGLDASDREFDMLVRGLQAADSSPSTEAAVSSGGTSADSTKLSLTNMGGVFLLHGLLSTIAVVCAALSWASQCGYLWSRPIKNHQWFTHKSASPDHTTDDDEFHNNKSNSKTVPSDSLSPSVGPHPVVVMAGTSSSMPPEAATNAGSPFVVHSSSSAYLAQREHTRGVKHSSRQEMLANLHLMREEVHARFNVVDERANVTLAQLAAVQEHWNARFDRLERTLRETCNHLRERPSEEEIEFRGDEDDSRGGDASACWAPLSGGSKI